ncbi:PTS IIA-like nitrogen regulatory protein PtsN [Candidatus Albibeggiatoa sp. nov. NOAA]|uniref:PTS IIA-like nitrogen regulatory protein PtsN n=1 Tax=Candidatus Albibeggiatoa sp. nov. NOAA TaxID=3162724 RepID=UPI0032F9D57E|nr:PTS IIA-like nitrogen regulatory protein PtsN [Thiotrichaceae bacterium]
MQIVDILSPERILCHVQATSKKRVLEYFSKLLATEMHDIGNREIYDSLLTRERLGSTSIGHGVAIPHARVSECNVTLGAFLQLETGVDYEAIDRQPVDLLFALLVPEECTQEHLDLLATLAEMFGDPEFRKQLRETEDCDEKFHILTQWQTLNN